MSRHTQARQQTQPQTSSPEQIALLTQQLDDWFLALRRAMAAYNALSTAYLSATGELPEGERRRGLPLFEFNASLDGREAIRCAIDLKKIDPAYLSHVMVPMIGSTGKDLLEAVEEIGSRVNKLRPLLHEVVAPVQPAEAT